MCLLQGNRHHGRFGELAQELQQMRKVGLDNRLVATPVRPLVWSLDATLGRFPRAGERCSSAGHVAAKDVVHVLQTELHHQVEHMTR